MPDTGQCAAPKHPASGVFKTDLMASNTRIYNETRRFHMKHKQAVRAVESCACAWVEYGVSVRDLSLSEAITARNHQASTREPLPFAELPGLIFRAPAGKEAATHREQMTAIEANQWARMQVQA